MKTYLLILIANFILSIGPVSASHTNDKCIIGGRFLKTEVEELMAQFYSLDSVEITESRWNEKSVNPLYWMSDWGKDFRTISMKFTHDGVEEIHNDCQAVYFRNNGLEGLLKISNCSDRGKSSKKFTIGEFHRDIVRDYIIVHLDLNPCQQND